MPFPARLSTALLCIVWVSEVVRILHPQPRLTGFGAACLATYMALALGRANRHIRAMTDRKIYPPQAALRRTICRFSRSLVPV